MQSFKEYLTEGFWWKKDSKKPVSAPKEPEKKEEPKNVYRRASEALSDPNYKPKKLEQHENPNGPVHSMRSRTLEHVYDVHRNTPGAQHSERYKELEAERKRRGRQPRMHIDKWKDYQKVKPKYNIHWKDADGKQHSGY